MKKEYLGDAVYAEVDGSGALVLTTKNGIWSTNLIVLEPEVIRRLDEYLVEMRNEIDRNRESSVS